MSQKRFSHQEEATNPLSNKDISHDEAMPQFNELRKQLKEACKCVRCITTPILGRSKPSNLGRRNRSSLSAEETYNAVTELKSALKLVSQLVLELDKQEHANNNEEVKKEIGKLHYEANVVSVRGRETEQRLQTILDNLNYKPYDKHANQHEAKR